MDIGIDMSSLAQNLPNTDGKNGLGSIKDSIDANTDLKDSLKEFGVTDFEMDYDTTTHKLAVNMAFIDLKYFNKFMNKDRDEKLEPIMVKFSPSSFSVKNCASLISDEMLKGLGDTQKGQEGSDGLDMSKFFTFKTTYHFPYAVKDYKSASGNGMLSEDKKSISFNNNLDDFTNDSFNGDLEVNFK